jgi:addiction module HigA family antidote
MSNGLPAFSPGEYLAEILEELGMSQAQLARHLGVSPMRISHIINGSRPVTAELALLLGKAFGQSARYWLNLQTAYDLKKSESDPHLCALLTNVGPLNPEVSHGEP